MVDVCWQVVDYLRIINIFLLSDSCLCLWVCVGAWGKLRKVRKPKHLLYKVFLTIWYTLYALFHLSLSIIQWCNHYYNCLSFRIMISKFLHNTYHVSGTTLSLYIRVNLVLLAIPGDKHYIYSHFVFKESDMQPVQIPYHSYIAINTIPCYIAIE